MLTETSKTNGFQKESLLLSKINQYSYFYNVPKRNLLHTPELEYSKYREKNRFVISTRNLIPLKPKNKKMQSSDKSK